MAITVYYLHQGLKHWQPLIGNVIGFSGVCITLWWNARATRQLEKARLDERCIALRNILFVEIHYELQQVILAEGRMKIGVDIVDFMSYRAQLSFNTGVYKKVRHEMGILTINEQSTLSVLSIFESLYQERLTTLGKPWDEQNGSSATRVVIDDRRSQVHHSKQLSFLLGCCLNAYKALEDNMPQNTRLLPLP